MPAKKIRALVLVSLACLGCRVGPPDIQPQAPNVASLDPQNWYIFYSGGEPLHPVADPTGVGAWLFPFPSGDGHVNYIQTPFNATTTLSKITITFKVESNAPQYKVLDTTDIP